MGEPKADNLDDAKRNGREGQTAIDEEIAWAQALTADEETWNNATPEERQRAEAIMLDLTEALAEIDRIFDIEGEAEFKAAWEEWLNREE